MFDENKDILTIECQDCAKIGSAALSSECNDCIGKKKFDILRLKTDLFTKEYDKKRRLLHILPFFMDVRLEQIPKGTKVIKEYVLPTGAKVEIFKDQNEVNVIYSIKIPETNITFSEIMDIGEEFEKFQETNETNNDLIHKWFLGYGILEHLLRDKNILEININAPGPKTAMRIVHAEFDEVVSNIYPSEDFLNHLATRLKISTGRPLNKAQPQLDGEIMVGTTKARIAAVIDPFSIFGTAYSIRVHRESPWTLPLLSHYKSINPLFSGLMSFIITHGRSFLSAGPRGSGKTSLLGALILEILPKYRIITIEDTQELPINSYKKLGYDLLSMKVRSALLAEGMEMPFDMGLRTTLRLGDSCLIIGEIRSKEGKVLYEAMRVGAMSNVVAGTIHSDSPYGVYDRVVHDLGVEKGSFKVTDIIIIVNQIKDPTGLSRSRRVLQVTEVLKDWEDEPKFQDLMVYDPKVDELVPTDFLLKGKSIVLKEILSKTKGYNDYDDLLKDIKLRAWTKELFLKIADKEELEAPYIAHGNLLFAKLFREIEPLKSKKNHDDFKKRYEEELKKYLNQKRKELKKNISDDETEENKKENKENIIDKPKKIINKKRGLLSKIFTKEVIVKQKN
jgi:archaeal flagellar protein FlaI